MSTQSRLRFTVSVCYDWYMANTETPKITILTEDSLEGIREIDGRLKSGGLYKILGKDGQDFYAFSPDGTGLIWHDSREDLLAEHG